MNANRDRPPFFVFLVLFACMIAVALGLAALDSPPQGRPAAAANQGQHLPAEGGDHVTASADPPVDSDHR